VETKLNVFLTLVLMEVIGQVHTLAAFTLGKESDTY
jgi:hypothetical protein